MKTDEDDKNTGRMEIDTNKITMWNNVIKKSSRKLKMNVNENGNGYGAGDDEFNHPKAKAAAHVK